MNIVELLLGSSCSVHSLVCKLAYSLLSGVVKSDDQDKSFINFWLLYLNYYYKYSDAKFFEFFSNSEICSTALHWVIKSHVASTVLWNSSSRLFISFHFKLIFIYLRCWSDFMSFHSWMGITKILNENVGQPSFRFTSLNSLSTPTEWEKKIIINRLSRKLTSGLCTPFLYLSTIRLFFFLSFFCIWLLNWLPVDKLKCWWNLGYVLWCLSMIFCSWIVE